MKTNLINLSKNPKTHLVLIGMALAWIIYLAFLRPDTSSKEVITTETNTVTTIQQVDTTWKEQATKKRPIRPKKTIAKNPEKEPESEKYDSVRIYNGVHHFEYGKFDWSVETGGTLLGYTFTPTFNIPTTTTTTTTTSVKTQYVYPKGIYAGMSTDSQLNWGVNASYVTKDLLIGYSYRPGTSMQPLTTAQTVPVHEVRAAVNLVKLWK